MSNIIELPGATPPKTETTEAPPQPRTRLSLAEASKAMGALAEARAIGGTKIVTPTTEAQRRGLEQHLSSFFSRYGEELLSNYFVMQQEYAPLLRALSTITVNVVRIIQQSQAAQELMDKATAEAQAKENQ